MLCAPNLRTLSGARCRIPLGLPRRSRAHMAAPRASKHVWALDFDGVICDSVGELALAAWKVCMGFINAMDLACPVSHGLQGFSPM